MVNNNTRPIGNDIESKMTEFFNANEKFFATGDVAGKKAFFSLGMYTRRVLEALEKEVATSGVRRHPLKRSL